MTAIVAVFAGVLGLVLGSFANVPIHRWPRGGTVAQPRRSSCPSCGQPIAPRDNIPVASWLLLRGRCRRCNASIPVRYLLVELATGALFAAAVVVWWPQPYLAAVLVLVWSLVVATAIDLEHRIIPNRLTLRLPLVLLPLLVVAAAVDGAWVDLRRAVIAAVALPLAMFLLSEGFRLLRGQPGIGMGDIKLAPSLGLAVGYLGGLELVVFGYATVIVAVLVALGLLAAGRAKLASRIPFGPYLAVGALLPVLAQEPSTRLVRSLLGL